MFHQKDCDVLLLIYLWSNVQMRIVHYCIKYSWDSTDNMGIFISESN